MTLDTLITHPAPERIRRPQWHSMVYAAFVVLILVVGYLTRGPADAETGLLKNPDQGDLRLLVLGESVAETRDCPTCATYIEQFAAAAAREGGRSVQLFGADGDPTTWPLTDLTAVTALLQNDEEFRDLVRTADIVVISLGKEFRADAFDPDSCVARESQRRPCRSGLRSQRDRLRTAIEDLLRPDASVVLLVT